MLKRNIPHTAVVLLLLVSINACTFNSIHVNEEREREQAASIMGSFYFAIQTKHFADVEFLFSETFYKTTTKDDLYRMLIKTQELLGEYKDGTLVDWKTRRVSGSNPLTEYTLVYDVRYDKYKARETINLKREKTGIKIISYNIASEGYLDQ